MADIVFSYAHEDKEWVMHLIDKLEDEGWEIWWDGKLLGDKKFVKYHILYSSCEFDVGRVQLCK